MRATLVTTNLLEVAVVVFGSVALCHYVIVYGYCSRDSRGYILPATKDLCFFVLGTTILHTLIGLVLIGLISSLVDWKANLTQVALATVGALVGVTLPTGVLRRFSTRLAKAVHENEPDARVSLAPTVMLAWIVCQYREAIGRLKSLDSLAIRRQEGWWDLGMSGDPQSREEEIACRIRHLYEVFKYEIANRQCDPHLLDITANYFPANQLFLLVGYLGRREFRTHLKRQPKSPARQHDWNGSERRKRRGQVEGRKQPDPNVSCVRASDDRQLRRQIKEGRFL